MDSHKHRSNGNSEKLNNNCMNVERAITNPLVQLSVPTQIIPIGYDRLVL